MTDERKKPARKGGMRARIRKGAQGLLLLTVSLAIAFGLGELMVRLVQPQQLILKRPDIWRSVDTLGWAHRAGVNTTINTGERTVNLRTDREGYRVRSEGRVEAPTQLLILGDSFLEALQVEYEESIAGLLEERLPARLGRPIAVRNAAVDGWDPRQYYAKVRSSLDKDDFELLVVFVYLPNDIIMDTTSRVPARTPKEVHPFRLPRSLSRAELTDAIFYPINDALEVRSHLFILFKRRFDTALMRLGLTAAYFPFGLRKSDAASRGWSLTADVCERIAAAAAEHGVPSLFVLLPGPIQVEPETLGRYAAGFQIDLEQIDLEQPNRLMGAALAERGLVVIDPMTSLREAHGRGVQLYGTVDRHFSPEGHSVVAGRVEEWVATNLRDRDEPAPTSH